MPGANASASASQGYRQHQQHERQQHCCLAGRDLLLLLHLQSSRVRLLRVLLAALMQHDCLGRTAHPLLLLLLHLRSCCQQLLLKQM
jgi:hypothetical protein